MNLAQLETAIRTALPFVCADKEHAGEPMTRLAVSFSRVRATDGKAAIHVWEPDMGDRDVGPVACITRRDARMIVAHAKNVLTGCEEPPVEWTLDVNGFAVDAVTLPMLDGVELAGEHTWPDSDRVIAGQWASHVEGRDRHLDPKRVALGAKAIATIGASHAQLLLGKASDTGMFMYGATSALAVVVLTMPMDGEAMPDLRDVMTPSIGKAAA